MISDKITGEGLPVLFVNCGVQIPRNYINFMRDHAYADTPEEGREVLLSQRFACVVVLIDPGRHQNNPKLEAMEHAAAACRVPLTSLSAFNPRWIAKLMDKLGVEARFRSFASTEETDQIFTGVAHGRSRENESNR